MIFLSPHLKSTPLFRTCQQQSTRRNSQATNKEWGPSSNRNSLMLQFVCCWGNRGSRANKPVVIPQGYQNKPKATERSKIFQCNSICWSYPTYNYWPLSLVYFYFISVFHHTVLYFIKKCFIVMKFTLPQLFWNPAISNFFPFSLGLRNSGIHLYTRNSRPVWFSCN